MNKKAFTLIEVLIVLTLLGLIFSILSVVFYSNIKNSLILITDSDKLKNNANIFWSINRKILSSKEILLEKGDLYMITSAGDYYEGIVKCAYIYRGGKLLYYEFPYPYGDLRFYEEEKLHSLGLMKNFKITAFKNEKKYDEFKGMPDYFIVELEDKIFIIKSNI